MSSPDFWLDLLHLADSAFPTGAFVHSAGLESLAPKALGELAALLRVRLRESVGRLELVFLLAASDQPLVPLDERLHAMLLTREARQANRQVGTQLLRASCELLDHPRLSEFRQTAPHGHLPVVFGAVAAAIGVPPTLAAQTYAFQQTRALVTAAQRLMRLGQRDAQRVLHSLKPEVDDAVTTAQQLTVEEAGAFAPVWDVASMAHERAAVRLFVS